MDTETIKRLVAEFTTKELRERMLTLVGTQYMYRGNVVLSKEGMIRWLLKAGALQIELALLDAWHGKKPQ
jgi:hypothetical protein